MEQNKIEHKKVRLANKQADAYIIPLGRLNLVSVITDKGMVGCGAFNVAALDNFGYPACCARSAKAGPIVTIDDILQGVIKEANTAAEKLGIKVGMSAEEALAKM